MKTPRTKPLDWDAMPPSERTVAVAKDVIAQLKQKAFVPTPGTYLEYNEKLASLLPVGDELRDHLTKLGRCKVCAKGAIFLCSVRLFDRAVIDPIREIYSNRVVWDLFRDNDSTIEHAFEGWAEDGTSERKFYDAHPDPEQRLIAIMENIIEHGGRFVL